MPSPTYLQRIQQVLGEVAKEDKTSIGYRQFLWKVRPRTLRSSGSTMSPFRSQVRRALLQEVDNGRINIDTAQNPPILHFTPEGKAFFEKVQFPSHGKRVRRLQNPRPSLKAQAHKDYEALAVVLRSIQTLFAEQTFVPAERYAVAKLSDTICCWLDMEQTLSDENLTLSFHLHDLSWEIARMRAAASLGQTQDEVDINPQ